jgi:type I restriction enzyme S subunit
LRSGVTPKGGEKVYLKVGVPLIRSQNVLMNKLNLSDVALISPEMHESMIGSAVQPGDVLLNITGASIGRVTFVPDELKVANVNQHVCRIRLAPHANPAFVSYYLSAPRGQAQVMGSQFGTTRQGLNYGNVRAIRIPLPPIEEQRAIARALETAQTAKEARQRELALERERKAALTELLFTHGTRGEPRKQTEIGEIPESWQVVKLRDIVTVKGGKRLPKRASFSEEPTSLPYIRVTDFRDGTVGTNDLKYVTPETQQAIRRYTISSDDVYISIAGTIGLVGTVPQQLDGANLTENAAKLVINDKASLDGDFLALILRSQCGQRQIQNLTTKTTQPKLALMRIEQVLVPKPSITEQREIASILRACESKLIGLGREITYLDELFRALLEELMTGRLSVASLIEEYRVQ